MSSQVTIAPSFKPSAFSNFVLWLDANDPNGTGAVPSDGQAVTTWVNKTTGVPNLTGSAVISKYQGRNSVNFPNTNSLYTTTGSVPVSSITFFMVWLQALTGGNGGGFNFGTNSINWQSDGIGFYSDAGGSKPGGSQGFRVYSGPTTVTGSGYITATSTDAVPLNLFSVTIDTAGNITIYKNGTVFQTATRAAGWGGNFNICGFGEDFRYGNPATNVTALQYISEILVYNKVLTTAERQKVEGYLTWKWGLQTNLPAAHSFLSSSPTSSIPGGTSPLQITLGNVLSTTATAFITDGATYTIPPKTSKIRIFVWGGGGAGAGYGSSGCGGSGAHVQGDFTVGGITSLTIYLNRGAGNGNFGNNGAGYGAVYNATTGYLLIAGGGGGSGSGYGGGAGYLQGFNGGSPSIAGQVSVQSTAALGSGGGGGSQTQGGDGAPSAQAGSYLQGGNSEGSGYPSAGGGGYYGGGGGNGNGAAGTRSGNGPGGGGSSYINLSYITNYKGFDGQSGSTVSVLPGGASSPYYVAGYGVGGRLTAGGGALVVIVPYLSGGGGATSSTAPAQITLGSSSIRALGGVTTIYNTYKIHTFATAGTATFTVTPPNALTVKVLVVGGGGGGGSDASLFGGGGGAGGLVYSRTMSLTPGTYQVVVGAGGPAGTIGGNSTFNGLVAYGGGVGGQSGTAGGNGGCGGGGGGVVSSPGGTGSQGFGGSSGYSQYVGGGGGGGMGAAGATTRSNNGNSSTSVDGFQGGDGVQVQITGTPTYYAGGGGGGGGSAQQGAPGGQGGGGTGGGNNTATAGTAGLGGGGGCGAAGGSGTVILAYLLPGQIATVTTPTVAAGLIFWMDGADPAGTGVLPANGASITTWVDKSGNGKNATASAAATYSLSTKSLVFTGAQYYTTPFTTVPTTISVFLVINIGGGGYMDMMAGVLQVISTGYNQLVTIPGGSHVLNGATMASGTTLLYNFTFDSSASAAIYYNGALTGTRNGSTSYTGNGSIVIGSSDGVHETYTGTISEILIYNSVLSTTNRQKIEGYLAWKWGFASNLSASNPYKYDLPM